LESSKSPFIVRVPLTCIIICETYTFVLLFFYPKYIELTYVSQLVAATFGVRFLCPWWFSFQARPGHPCGYVDVTNPQKGYHYIVFI
jgi:hypothetical protein